LISDKLSGKLTVQLIVSVRPDGTVSSAEVVKAPDPEIGDQMARAARQWLFYPIPRDGVVADTSRSVNIEVMAIKHK
jgi:TonB family protein